MGVNEWRDAARKLPRHIDSHYPNVPRKPDGEAWFPLRGTNPAGGEVWWAVTEQTARRWRQVRGNAKP